MIIKLLTGVIVFESIDWEIVCGMKYDSYFNMFHIHCSKNILRYNNIGLLHEYCPE